jgi:hypothetical protein
MPKGQNAGTRVAWDDGNKARLYQAIVDTSAIPAIKWNEVAAATGIEGVTAVACQ